MVASSLKGMIYSRMISHHNGQNVYSGVGEWDLDIVLEYFTIDVYNTSIDL